MIYEFEYAGRTVRIKSTDKESAEKYFYARYPQTDTVDEVFDSADTVEFTDDESAETE